MLIVAEAIIDALIIIWFGWIFIFMICTFVNSRRVFIRGVFCPIIKTVNVISRICVAFYSITCRN